MTEQMEHYNRPIRHVVRLYLCVLLINVNKRVHVCYNCFYVHHWIKENVGIGFKAKCSLY